MSTIEFLSILRTFSGKNDFHLSLMWDLFQLGTALASYLFGACDLVQVNLFRELPWNSKPPLWLGPP